MNFLKWALVFLWFATPVGGQRPSLLLGEVVRPPMGAIGLCQKYAWACDATQGSVSDQAALEYALYVNSKVNREVVAGSDQEIYGVEERWAIPLGNRGDCEDYVLQKKLELLLYGVGGRRLLIATVLDHNRDHHAVLVLDILGVHLVLDNLTDEILPWHQTGYVFLRVQEPSKKDWRLLL